MRNQRKKIRIGCIGWFEFKPETELAIPFKRSKKIDFAFSREGSLEVCLESFQRNNMIEMTRKKIAAVYFLPKTPPSMAIVI